MCALRTATEEVFSVAKEVVVSAEREFSFFWRAFVFPFQLCSASKYSSASAQFTGPTMTTLKKRERAKTNASLISMVQRFSDITIMFGGLWIICKIKDLPFLYMHLLMALLTLVVFQMIGGITDFYRSWRGVKITTELMLLLQNWTLSLVFSAGLLAFNNDFNNSFAVWFAWYLLSTLGLVACRSCIRFGAGWLRHRGYNTRRVAIAGPLPVGMQLAESFRNEPWLGFDVAGIYHDPQPEGVPPLWAGNLDQLVDDAKSGKIHNIYIAMAMSDEARIKNLVRQLSDTTCSVMLIPDVFTFNILHSRTDEVNGVPVVPLFDTPLNGINRLLKRAEDIVLASFDSAADLAGAVLHRAGGQADVKRTGDIPPDPLRYGRQAHHGVEIPLHESHGKRGCGDPGHAKRSARDPRRQLPAPHLAG
ncbi:putative colanic biosynthesis UDP-glucose lipid carrier transferase [Atlantibacter hermannii]|nr:putative colanic biosynthesis UDP-glucose lipid carrier transferase [Atlantibacter hermannii]